MLTVIQKLFVVKKLVFVNIMPWVKKKMPENNSIRILANKWELGDLPIQNVLLLTKLML